jgi:hypothetical protein
VRTSVWLNQIGISVMRFALLFEKITLEKNLWLKNINTSIVASIDLLVFHNCHHSTDAKISFAYFIDFEHNIYNFYIYTNVMLIFRQLKKEIIFTLQLSGEWHAFSLIVDRNISHLFS